MNKVDGKWLHLRYVCVCRLLAISNIIGMFSEVIFIDFINNLCWKASNCQQERTRNQVDKKRNWRYVLYSLVHRPSYKIQKGDWSKRVCTSCPSETLFDTNFALSNHCTSVCAYSVPYSVCSLWIVYAIKIGPARFHVCMGTRTCDACDQTLSWLYSVLYYILEI